MLAAMNGFIWGLIVVLVALGLSLIFGLLEVINLAHGELYMLGAVIGFFLTTSYGDFWLALVISPLIVGLLGLFIQRFVLTPIQNRPVVSIIATFGLIYVLRNVAGIYFGRSPRRVLYPLENIIALFDYGYPLYRILVAIISATLLVILWIFLHKTKFGLWIRASKENRELALLMGIPIHLVQCVTFGLGAALCGVAGVLMMPITSVSTSMGFDILFLAFIVVIVGGLGNLKGTLIASIAVSELEGIAAVYLEPYEARVLTLALMVAILAARIRLGQKI